MNTCIHIVADDTSIFAFQLCSAKGKQRWSTMMKWRGIGDVGAGGGGGGLGFGDNGADISIVITTRHKSISTLCTGPVSKH